MGEKNWNFEIDVYTRIINLFVSREIIIYIYVYVRGKIYETKWGGKFLLR